MKLVIPYAGEFPTQAVAAVTQLSMAAYTWNVGDTDSAYFDLLARLWRARESFIIIEHDIIVTAAAIAGLIDCPMKWCTCPYPWYDSMLHGLGCTKFDHEIMQDFPSLFDNIADIATDVHPAKHWCNIDDRINRYMGERRRNAHRHDTPVEHLRPYASHGCV